jgi:hypothetical protein
MDGLVARGIDVTTEAYPYTAGMTRLDSNVFSEGWEVRLKIAPSDIEYLATGERLTEKTFGERRARGGLVAIHSIPQRCGTHGVQGEASLTASNGK